MNGYASNTRTRRNLAALMASGWRLLITPENPAVRNGFCFGVDNGAWGCSQRREPFNGTAFAALVERIGCAADFVVVPDIVAGGLASLEFSVSWMYRLRHLKLPLLAIQDGMSADNVGAFLREYPKAGLFLGGSTEFKLREMYGWGLVAHAFGRYYHVGRVNTARRIRLCAEAGADSFDGTSATMFSCTLPLLDAARRQPSFLTPAAQHRI